MAASIRSHCHLDTADPPVVEYSVQAGSWDATPEVAVSYEKGITGVLHTHRLLSGAVPVQFPADKCILLCTLAQKIVVQALIGRRVYYVSNYHDDGAVLTWGVAAETVRGVLIIPQGGITPLGGAMAEYWAVQIQIVSDDET